LVKRVAALGEEGTADEEAMKPWLEQFQAALDNDLNTSLAVTALYDVLKADLNDAAKRALIARFDEVLGLDLLGHAAALKEKEAAPAQSGEGDAEIEALIAQRAQAKAAKNWAEADRIRDELKAQGIELIDTKEGTTWKRV
ncbi:MAG: cysteine--tRNA ligase, partial [Oscillospiraceae bacterium]|nr:cysteine--tRNA ligase [Oscillospiraceae bacterium]